MSATAVGTTRTSDERTARLAWLLAGLAFVLAIATVAFYIPARSVQPAGTWGIGGDSVLFIFVVPFLAFPIVGALIAARHPANAIGWIFLVGGCLWMLNQLCSQYGVYGVVARPGAVPLAAEVGSIGEWLWVPAVGLIGIYLLLLFPNGKLLSRRWRPVAWLVGAVIVLHSLSIMITPRLIEPLGGVSNPFGIEGYPWITDVLVAARLLFVVCQLAGAASLILRYRRSVGEERQQMKWIAFAAALVAVLWLVATIAAALVQEVTIDAIGGAAQPLWLQLLQSVVSLSGVGIPVASGFAILKYRLYDIDFVIKRTLLYAALTLTLGATYLIGVALLQLLFVRLTGQESTLAVVASTLAIAALFGPLRRRVQAIIDRRFFRRTYDAQQVLVQFAQRVGQQADLDTLAGDVVGVVRETLEPETAQLWLIQVRQSSNASPEKSA